jgi:6-phosphogluconolactonase (cycloisomerase 2 family)
MRPAATLLVGLATLAGLTPAGASNRYLPAATVTAPCGQADHLEGASEIIVSPDDAHVYVGSGGGPPYNEGSLTVFERDGTGALTLLTQYLSSDPSLGALAPRSLAISPDGATLYVASTATHSVHAFERDAVDGSLVLIDLETDGLAGVDGLGFAQRLVVSPDGAHVYVTGSLDDAVAVFSRDGGTGTLSYLGMVQDGVGGISGLNFASRLLISPDGAHLYVGGPDGLVTLARNAGTGELTYVATLHRTFSGMAVSPDGAFVYLRGNNFSGLGEGINVFARDAGTGLLSFVDFEPASGFELAIDPAGTHVYTNTIEIFARDGLTGILSAAGTVSEAPNGVDGLDGLAQMAFPSGGAQLYSAAFRDAAVATFDRNLVTGALTQTGLVFDAGLPLAAAVSPDGEHVYVTCGRAIATFDRDAGSGGLTRIDSRKHASIAGDDLVFPSNIDDTHMVVAPNGRHVYLQRSVHFDTGIVEVLTRDSITGLLSFTQLVDAGGPTTTVDIQVSPDDEHVYVCHHYFTSAFIYDRDPIGGLLTFVDDVTTPIECETLALSPDGADLYLLGRDFVPGADTLVASFARDAGSGALTAGPFAGDMPNFEFDGAIVASGDGTNVYVGGDQGWITTFARDSGTGALVSPVTISDGTGATTGLADIQRLAVTPDGVHVLAVSEQPGGVAVLRRRTDGGTLSFVESHADGAPGFEGLTGGRDVVVSPDSRFAYVTAKDDDSITILARTPGCTPAPAAGCHAATGARLKIKTPGGDVKRTLVWKWQDATVPVIGNPLTTSDVALCVYDGSGGGQPLVDAVAPAGGACGTRPCWQSIDGGFKYADKERTPDGLQRVQITPKPGQTSTVKVKARGANLPGFTLPLTAPVTVQLQASTGECLEAMFASVVINDGTKYIATVP